MTAKPSEPDDPAIHGLRAANQLLDERPRPALRDAILRAAADAKAPAPLTATPGKAAVRKGRWRSGFGWSPAISGLAMAGIALFAIAVLLNVWHKGPQDRPVEIAQADSTVAGAAAAPAPASPPASTALAASAAPQEARPAPAAAAPIPVPARPFPPAPAPAAPPAGARTLERTPLAMQAPLASAADRQRDDTPVLKLSEAPAGRVAARALGAPVAAPPYRTSTRSWIERLIELRHAHADREADEEMALFRAAHPDVPIPAEAQRGKDPGPQQ